MVFKFFLNSSFCSSWPFGVPQVDNCRLAARALVALESDIRGVGVGLPHCRGSLAAFLFVSHLLPLVTVGDSLQGPPPPAPPTCFSASNRKLLLLSLEVNANELPAVLFCIPDPLAAVILFST